MNLTLCAPCLFGLESVLSGEIKRIGGENIETTDGRVTFTGDLALLARANLWLRTAERVCIVLGSFTATSFTELFDQTTELPFEDFIGKKDAFPVKGWSLKSGLHSIPDCQSIIKKAAVKRLEKVYEQAWFEETGPLHQIQFAIHKDVVTIMLDTSGAGLHKRGYRATSTEAPIKETLAAGIADLARVRTAATVVDPMCGSGTLLIESALRAFDIAPGIRRRFSAESWGVIPASVWQKERDAAKEAVLRDKKFRGIGFDLDPEAATLTLDNAGKAGVGSKILAAKGDLADFHLPDGDVTVLCNPPYGERLLELQEAEELYRTMGKVFPQRPGASYYIISPHEQFESLFGRKAAKRRKLYNGMIKCQLFMYY
jgi:putative N6-adenine-specific DNA methylase